MGSLPTGPKLRNVMLSGAASKAFCFLVLCTAISRSGRAGVAATTAVTRATQNLPPSSEMARALMDKMNQIRNFNGIAGLCPELGLVLASSGGSVILSGSVIVAQF